MNKDHVFLIAEMACSHEGNPAFARKIIDGAGQAGADAIQFQIWKLQEMMVPHHPDFEKVSKIELAQEEWADLAAYVREHYPQMQKNFPTLTDEVHLRYMIKLKQLFELPIGYQDHSDADTEAAFWLPAVALGMGVDILEKHITHDRSFKGVDHEAALNPDEFARFVQMVRTIEGAMGISTPKSFLEEELKYRKYAKKSLVASRDLPTGSVLSDGDLTFMRAEEMGLPPDQSSRLIGQQTRRFIARYQLVREEDVE